MQHRVYVSVTDLHYYEISFHVTKVLSNKDFSFKNMYAYMYIHYFKDYFVATSNNNV